MKEIMKMFSFRISNKLREEIKETAEKEGRNTAAQARHLILLGLKSKRNN